MADNPYVNKVVYGDQTLIDLTDTTADASDVASGKYFYNAAGARTLGTSTPVQSDWNETDSTSAAYIQNKPTLATVATSGNYNDLSNKITIDSALSSSSTNPVQNKIIQGIIGSGTLNTTNKTLIGAVNEIFANNSSWVTGTKSVVQGTGNITNLATVTPSTDALLIWIVRAPDNSTSFYQGIGFSTGGYEQLRFTVSRTGNYSYQLSQSQMYNGITYYRNGSQFMSESLTIAVLRSGVTHYLAASGYNKAMALTYMYKLINIG